MSSPNTYPLRLPKSLKTAVEAASRKDGTSVNQFVAIAVAEKIAALAASTYFNDKKNRADFAAYDAILSRQGGLAPVAGDDITP